ncbi:hypothetical protein BDV59DRAFT_49513 [Aspergillus ambiguus]|uniref:uncharacterized protein n=1 Tax=Aspergillus ambiguus TaxID=176160 RepID=UPI003CCC9194
MNGTRVIRQRDLGFMRIMITAYCRSLRNIGLFSSHLYIQFCLVLAICCIKDGFLFVLARIGLGLYFHLNESESTLREGCI